MLKSVLLSSCAFVALGMATHATAKEFEVGDAEVRVDTTLSYTHISRVESFSEGTNGVNADDGNRNYSKEGSVSNILRATTDVEIVKEFPENDMRFGGFVRGVAFYDFDMVNRTNDHNAPGLNNSSTVYGGPLSNTQTFTPETVDQAGRNARILDAFVYGDFFRSTENPLNIRVGQQVVNWGESLFIQQGITNYINVADVSTANIPGTEVREILLPTNQVFASLGLTPDISAEAFWQIETRHTIAPAHGTYLSDNDFIPTEGGSSILLPFAPGSHIRNAGVIDPDDGTNYGAALRWFAPINGGTDFGFYYANYSSKLPALTVQLTAPPGPGNLGNYFISYYDDITLLGASFNTTLFDTAVSGEVSYHIDYPIQTVELGAGLGQSLGSGSALVPLTTREDMVIAQLTLNKDLNNVMFLEDLADNVSALGEFGYVNVVDLEQGEIFRGPDPIDAQAMGVRGRMSLVYFDWFGQYSPILSGTDLEVDLNYSYDFDGVSPLPAGSFTQGAHSAGLVLRANFQNELEGSLSYTNFMNGSLEDRDFVSFNAKYRF